jgi:hypothetical protein
MGKFVSSHRRVLKLQQEKCVKKTPKFLFFIWSEEKTNELVALGQKQKLTLPLILDVDGSSLPIL